jgi:hypothetical protein
MICVIHVIRVPAIRFSSQPLRRPVHAIDSRPEMKKARLTERQIAGI